MDFMLKSKELDRLWRDLETVINSKATTKAGWTYDVDAAGQYTLRHNGVVKGRGDHAAAMAKCRNNNAKTRVNDFHHTQDCATTTGSDVAAARLRLFQLQNDLDARGA
jgi:hypothetical protein